MVIAGVVTTAGLHSANINPNTGSRPGTWAALMAAISWGIGYGFLAEGVKLLGWVAASAVQFSVLAFFCSFCLLIVKIQNSDPALSPRSLMKNPFILGAAVTQQLGAILLNIGLSDDTTGGSIIVALSACYPVLTTIMAFFVFKERIPLPALVAGALAIAGIVVLSA
jgi:drug/metabolite transporter (DMT)-like permease